MLNHQPCLSMLLSRVEQNLSLTTTATRTGETVPVIKSLPPVAPPHPREIDHPRAGRRKDEALPVPQSRAGPFLLAGVEPVKVDTVGEVEQVGVAGVDDGGASLEQLPVDLNVLRCEERTRRFRVVPQGR